MTRLDASPAVAEADVISAVRQYWGFDTLRDMQYAAICAGLEQRDSLVVMPTGGGKSLCYQVPPLVANRTDVVVSPLIALMKDQVDGLQTCGYPAAAIHGAMSPEEVDAAEALIASGDCRLIFAAPERLLTGRFLSLLERLDVRTFAIDEAHCISHWGHDFRQHYRLLRQIKSRFPGASVHAFTATATERVRDDIVEQLGLDNPTVLVGVFDRPNLTYRVMPKMDVDTQVLETVRRHRDEAVIVYCISRRETESLATYLKGMGVRAAHYHAGMEPDQRRETQDAFSSERLDVIVATVAFGMGVDRSDVRCVIHTSMPKSIEHYQQETGRAGRDGLDAECVLFYSPRDMRRWSELVASSAQEARDPDEVRKAGLELLGQMQLFCVGGRCRHRAISDYFGQPFEKDNCGACDICLGESNGDEEATVLAQKVISCVARVESRFGRGHVADVLLGRNTRPLRQFGHTELSTFGLLRDLDRNALLHVLDQIIDQGLLTLTSGDRPLVKLNTQSWEVLRGQREVRLAVPQHRGVVKAASLDNGWIGVDRGLFEHLREVRRKIAEERGVPPFVIFSNRTLQDMARKKPRRREDLLSVHGVGQRKLDDLGFEFVQAINAYLEETQQDATDQL